MITVMRRRIEKRFEQMLAADVSIELLHRKLSTSIAKELSEIESATTKLNVEFNELEKCKQAINIHNKTIVDIKMRLKEKELQINLQKKENRLHKKLTVKQTTELEADIGIPLNDQTFKFKRRVKHEIVLRCANFTMDFQMNNSEAIEQRRMFTLHGNNLCVITGSPEESGRAAWDLVGQTSESGLANWSELFDIY